MIDSTKLSKSERILWNYGITDPAEIDLEAIAFGLGATVRYRKLDGCDARIVGNTTTATISINTNSYPARQRFSLAHEIGHWYEDRRTGVLPCAAEDIGPQNAEARSKEATANAFASQLILPDYLFKPMALGRPPNLDTASCLAEKFQASLTATTIKLAKVSPIITIAVCHSQTQREWFVRSNAALTSDLWPIKQIHHDTNAFELLFGDSSNKSTPKNEPANKWLTGLSIFNSTVKVQSTKLPDGTVLSLLFVI
ncbi:ImmA/IrrE family metallo-endopeptidase [Methylobacter sp. G7]|uniref:ImmA/IrrE family metallo-endopeptidase n=1 Tax=Methylobacter sp. G7 TaxID=3230117 RepID=UPI003D80741A